MADDITTGTTTEPAVESRPPQPSWQVSAVGERTSEQIALDFAPLTADEGMQAQQLKLSLFEALADGKMLAPAPADYTDEHREQIHDAFVLLTLKIEHREDQLRHFTNMIQPKPGEVVPEDPIKTPDPIDARTQAVLDAVSKGATLDDAIATVDKE